MNPNLSFKKKQEMRQYFGKYSFDMNYPFSYFICFNSNISNQYIQYLKTHILTGKEKIPFEKIDDDDEKNGDHESSNRMTVFITGDYYDQLISKA